MTHAICLGDVEHLQLLQRVRTLNSIFSYTHKIANESQRIIKDYVAVILVSEENMPSAGRTGKEFITSYKTYFSGQSLGTTMSNLILPNSKEILLLLLKSSAV